MCVSRIPFFSTRTHPRSGKSLLIPSNTLDQIAYICTIEGRSINSDNTVFKTPIIYTNNANIRLDSTRL